YMDTLSNNSQSNSVFRFVLLLVVIVFAFLLFFLYQTKKKPGVQPPISTIVSPPTPVVTTAGSFSLQSVTRDMTAALDKALDLDIVASSDQKSIVGYDVVVKFEEGAVEILSATSLLPDFVVYLTQKSDHYIVTGAKKPESSEPTVYDNTSILRLTVMPKKTGPLTISLADKLGIEKSQMVDEKTQILKPEVGAITIEVK
ncbi:hypothetical protein HY612_02935, partial [Candidatus Roizmanbacteria bacterium]|nr:hypothetical protein [Candidatus Roizmanbacteria bacterium]